MPFDSHIHVGADIHADTRSTACTEARDETNWATVRFTELARLLGIALPHGHGCAGVTFPVRRLKAGETLHRAGDTFNALYVVRSGFLKTVSVDTSGAELVLGFPMGGDVVGLDGIDSGHYLADVVALDMSSIAVIPFAQLSQLAHDHPAIERLLYSIFSRELAHKQSMFWVLGTLSAEARIASFLLDLSERFGRLGYSRTAFALRATRQEIGGYLGLKLETVSRTLSAFAAAGLVDIDRREVVLRDLEGLRRVIDPALGGRAGDLPAKPTRVRTTAPSRSLPRQAQFALAA